MQDPLILSRIFLHNHLLEKLSVLSIRDPQYASIKADQGKGQGHSRHSRSGVWVKALILTFRIVVCLTTCST